MNKRKKGFKRGHIKKKKNRSGKMYSFQFIEENTVMKDNGLGFVRPVFKPSRWVRHNEHHRRRVL